MTLITITSLISYLAAGLFAWLEKEVLRRDSDEQTRRGLHALQLGFLVIFSTGVTLTVGEFPFSAAVNLLLALSAIGFSILILKRLTLKFVGGSVANRSYPRFAWVLKKVSLLVRPITPTGLDDSEEFEQEIIESVEDFSQTIVREVMVPRVDMAVINAEVSLSESMNLFLSRGFSRLPVIGRSVDDVIGILFLKDVTRFWSANPDLMNTSTVETLMREASFVPESKPVDDLLREMQASATHMVVVVDEYGGIAGVATLEDLIEEIVGEIKDEYDSNSVDIEKLGEYKYRVAAKYSLFELGEEIGLELDDDEVDSVGGLFSKVLGRLPQKGDSVEFAGLELRVERLEARRKRLVTLLVEVTESAQAQLQAMRKIPGKQND